MRKPGDRLTRRTELRRSFASSRRQQPSTKGRRKQKGRGWRSTAIERLVAARTHRRRSRLGFVAAPYRLLPGGCCPQCRSPRLPTRWMGGCCGVRPPPPTGRCAADGRVARGVRGNEHQRDRSPAHALRRLVAAARPRLSETRRAPLSFPANRLTFGPGGLGLRTGRYAPSSIYDVLGRRCSSPSSPASSGSRSTSWCRRTTTGTSSRRCTSPSRRPPLWRGSRRHTCSSSASGRTRASTCS